MKTTEMGDLGKSLVIADLLRKKAKPSLPLCENIRYDLIADYRGRLLRIQCKATRIKNGVLKAKCTSTSSWASKTRAIHKYTAHDIDYIAVADIDSGKVYYIPAKDLEQGRYMVSLRIEATKNNQKAGIRTADSYCTF